MATGGTFSGGSGEDWKEFLTCSLCLEIFRSPKLLPCHHSFCLPCLEDLALRHGSGSFPCPQCRRDVTVPSGGVASFQNNFHVNPKDLEKARNGEFCAIHPKQDVDIYCVDCKMPVCPRCTLTDHKSHTTEDLHKAARRTIRQLKGDKDRLQKAVSCVEDRVKAKKTEQQSLQDKKSAVKEAITRKLGWLITAAVKYCEDSLASLTAATGDWDSRLTEDLDREQKNLDQLCQLRQHVQEAVSSGKGCRVMSVAKEMVEGQGRPQVVSQLMSSERNSIHRPVLSCKVAEDVILPLVRDYFGLVEMVDIEDVMAPDVEVERKFCCGKEEENVQVFSLCPCDDRCEAVSVSFARRGIRNDAPSEAYDEKGKHLRTVKRARGKSSFKYRGNNDTLFRKNVPENDMIIYDKSHKKTIFRLMSYSSEGTADMEIETVVSEDPFETKITKLFTISSGTPRAFDVDSSKQHYVVLEEPGPAPDIQRKVRLYHCGQPDAVATYRPPSAACRPSDVCFWREPGGREILVVADEGTDSLHVVNVRGNEFSSEGYLAPGSPLIIQPTALNTDTRGRLWVALRGGQIITVSGLKKGMRANRYRSYRLLTS